MYLHSTKLIFIALIYDIYLMHIHTNVKQYIIFNFDGNSINFLVRS